MYVVMRCLNSVCMTRDAADKVVKGKGKFEELVVCSQEISASTAQLVVSSKVKAQRDSDNLRQLSEASKHVSAATGDVVASAKSGAERIEDFGERLKVTSFVCLSSLFYVVSSI